MRRTSSVYEEEGRISFRPRQLDITRALEIVRRSRFFPLSPTKSQMDAMTRVTVALLVLLCGATSALDVGENDALVEVSALWGCSSTPGCGYCGAGCDATNDHVVSFVLSNVALPYLPSSFGKLVYLNNLAIQNSQLATLPSSFGSLTALANVDLSANVLDALPDAFGKLTALGNLNLHSNNLVSIPPNFEGLVSLASLNLEQNKLVALSEQFGQLPVLGNLRLNNNQHIHLPSSFANLPMLTALTFYDSSLNASDLAAIAGVGTLKDLEVENCKIERLPDSLGAIQSLTTLLLARNQLTILPDTFASLVNVASLSLEYNFLDCAHLTEGSVTLPTIFTTQCVNQQKCSDFNDDWSGCNSWVVCHYNYSTLTCDAGVGEHTSPPFASSSAASSSSLNDFEMSSSSSSSSNYNDDALASSSCSSPAGDLLQSSSSSSKATHGTSVVVIIKFIEDVNTGDLPELQEEIANVLSIDAGLVSLILISPTEVQVTIIGSEETAQRLVDIINNDDSSRMGDLLRKATEAYIRREASSDDGVDGASCAHVAAAATVLAVATAAAM